MKPANSFYAVCTGLVAALLLCGCGGGPSESDYVAACMTQRDVTESQCECAARESKKLMSADTFEAMILEIRGNNREASAIMQSLAEDEQAAAIEATLEVFDRCIADE